MLGTLMRIKVKPSFSLLANQPMKPFVLTWLSARSGNAIMHLDVPRWCCVQDYYFSALTSSMPLRISVSFDRNAFSTYRNDKFTFGVRIFLSMLKSDNCFISIIVQSRITSLSFLTWPTRLCIIRDGVESLILSGEYFWPSTADVHPESPRST